MTLSFLDSLLDWSRRQPTKVALSFLDDDGAVTASMTYSEVVASSLIVANHLRYVAKINEGDRVVLVYPPSLDFIIAFLACMFAGVIAVPTFPPDPSRLNKDLHMFTNIVRSCNAKVALTSTVYNFASKVGSLRLVVSGSSSGETWPELEWIVTDNIIKSSTKKDMITLTKSINDNTIAFLQYTSGSTSEPKGVIITHGNLTDNLNLIITGLSAVDDTVVVSWLPQYHDMGLIGSYLGAMYCGGCGYYLSPYSYIRNPSVWIRSISKYRATHMQAPNFAYTLTARKFLVQSKSKQEDDSNINLSCVRHMINAAEPVEASAMDTFYAVFSKYGLPPGVIYPTYGLAEHTVYVCSNGNIRIRVDKEALECDQTVKLVDSKDPDTDNKHCILVGCGRPSDSKDLDLRIAKADGDINVELPDGKVGEIWVKSPSCAKGYWGLPDKTAEDFDGKLSSNVDLGEMSYPVETGGYLRTGDLGFIHKKELFICGRSKDLIIVRGRNHYPQDIERTCESADSNLRGGCSAAFSIMRSGEEILVYACEVTDVVQLTYDEAQTKYSPLIDRIKSQVSGVHGVSVSVVVILKARTIPKTTSGKIARQWVRRSYLEGKLSEIYSWSSDDRPDEAFYDNVSRSNLPLSVPGSLESDSPMDPTGRPKEEVLAILFQVIATCTGRQLSEIVPDVPLVALGMDSMRGIELQSELERKFTVMLPDELLFESDVTLQTICNTLIAGGHFKPRPIIVEAWKLLGEVRKVEAASKGNKTQKGALSNQWFKNNATKANIDSYKFHDNCALTTAPLKASEDGYFLICSLMAFGGFPAVAAALCLLIPLVLHWKVVTAIYITLFSLFSAQTLMRESWPPGLKKSAIFEYALRYFSYRVIVEKKFSTSVPSIYAMCPSGDFSIAPTIQAMLNEYVNGENMHVLLSPSSFYLPVHNVVLKLIGCKAIDAKGAVMSNTLSKLCRSIGLVPSRNDDVDDSKSISISIKNSKDFVRVALTTGSQIIPCFTFGNTHLFQSKSKLPWASGRFSLPIPFRQPLLTVVGRPIQCPQTAIASAELVHEYHQIYLSEIRRVFETYKNTYGWKDKRIVFVA